MTTDLRAVLAISFGLGALGGIGLMLLLIAALLRRKLAVP